MEETLELVKREKYLGFFVTDSFYDNEYIKNEIGNTYARGNTIIRHYKTVNLISIHRISER